MAGKEQRILIKIAAEIDKSLGDSIEKVKSMLGKDLESAISNVSKAMSNDLGGAIKSVNKTMSNDLNDIVGNLNRATKDINSAMNNMNKAKSKSSYSTTDSFAQSNTTALLSNANAATSSFKGSALGANESVANYLKGAIGNFENGMTDDFNRAMSNVNKTMQSASKAVKVGAAGIGAGLTGLVVSSVKTGKEFEHAMSQVKATMLLDTDSEDPLKAAEAQKSYAILENAAKECGRTTKYSNTEAAEALNYLALAGYNAEKAATALPTILNLASAGAMDLATTSDMVTDAMSALSIEATEENLAMFADQMAKTSSIANTSVSQLGEGLLQVGGNAKLLKGGLTEANTNLAILANVGIKSAEGGTLLRNVIQSLTNLSGPAEKQMKKLGISVSDAQGNMRDTKDIFVDFNKALTGMGNVKRQEILGTIFNKTDLKGVIALMSATTTDLTKLKSQLSDVGIQYEKHADTINDIITDYSLLDDRTKATKKIMNEMGVSMEDSNKIFDVIIANVNTASNSYDQLTNKIENSKNACKDMSEIQNDDFTGDFTKFQSQFQTLQTDIYSTMKEALRPIVQSGTDSIARIGEAFNANKPEITEFFNSAASSLINLVEASTNGVIYVITNWDKIKPVVMGAVGAFLMFKTVSGAIKIVSLARDVSTLVSGFRTSAVAISAGSAAVGGWSSVASIGTAITTGFGAAMTFLTGPIGLTILAIGALVIGLVILCKNWDKVKEASSNCWNGVKSGAETAVNWIINGINWLIGAINKIPFINIKKIEPVDWTPEVEAAEKASNEISNALNEGIDLSGLSEKAIELGQILQNVDIAGLNTDEITQLESYMEQAGIEGGAAYARSLKLEMSNVTVDGSMVNTSTVNASMEQAGLEAVESYKAPFSNAGAESMTEFASSITANSGVVTGSVDAMGQTINTSLDSSFATAENRALTAMQQITSITTTEAQNAANAIKTAFESMTITIPKPKIPQINVTNSSIPYGDGGSVSIPNFDVSWHAQGGIFTQPTILGSYAGPQGFGEAGQEAILPLDTLWGKMETIMRNILNSQDNNVPNIINNQDIKNINDVSNINNTSNLNNITNLQESIKPIEPVINITTPNITNDNNSNKVIDIASLWSKQPQQTNTIDTLKQDMSTMPENSGDNSWNVKYSPSYNFYSSEAPDEQKVKEATKMSQAEFNKMMDAYMKQKKRTAF